MAKQLSPGRKDNTDHRSTYGSPWNGMKKPLGASIVKCVSVVGSLSTASINVEPFGRAPRTLTGQRSRPANHLGPDNRAFSFIETPESVFLYVKMSHMSCNLSSAISLPHFSITTYCLKKKKYSLCLLLHLHKLAATSHSTNTAESMILFRTKHRDGLYHKKTVWVHFYHRRTSEKGLRR